MHVVAALASLFQPKAPVNQATPEEKDLRARIEAAAQDHAKAVSVLTRQLDTLEPFHKVTELFRN